MANLYAPTDLGAINGDRLALLNRLVGWSVSPSGSRYANNDNNSIAS